MKIAIGCDHGGYELKRYIKTVLDDMNIESIDFGTTSTDPIDYPIYAVKVAKAVANKEVDKGILICGSGIGMSICANKVKGIRAALCNDLYTAKYSRLHNDANVLCLVARVVSPDLAKEIICSWIDTAFEGGRHEQRVKKMMGIEKNN